MRRPPQPHQLADLVHAAEKLDCQLELALMRVGVIGRCDLRRVRLLLRHAGATVLAADGPTGERSLWFRCRGTLTGALDDSGVLHYFTIVPDALAAIDAQSTIDAAS